MKGLDTNILVRYFIQDDLDQLQQTIQLFDQATQTDDVFLINDVVLCEFIWVMESRYKYRKIDLLSLLESLLHSSLFAYESRRVVEQAFSDFRNSRADFSDCLINRRNQDLDCTETYTFDRKTQGLNGFTVLVGA